MPKFPISLGNSYGTSIGGATPVMPPAPELYYPTVCLEWGSDYELPDEGIISFRYRVTRSVEEKRPGGEKYKEDLDLLELVEVVPAKAEKKDEDYGGPALDKLRDEVTKED